MTKILNIRGVEDHVAREFSVGANARGLTQAEYLRRLLAFRFDVCLIMDNLEANDPVRVVEEIKRRIELHGLQTEVV